MAREATYQGVGASGGLLMIPFYGVNSCAVNIIRADNANATGTISARNIIPKGYIYDSNLYNVSGPAAIYGLPTKDQSLVSFNGFSWTLSTIAAPKETISGRALTKSGAGALVNTNLPVARLQGQALMVPGNVQLVDSAVGLIAGQENGGLAWSVEGWIYPVAYATQSLYLEGNAGLTGYIHCYIDGVGAFHVGTNAGSFGPASTAAGYPPLNQWSHWCITNDGATRNIYTNGGLHDSGAYAHAAGIPVITQRQIHNGAGGSAYSHGIAVYQRALAAWEINQHYLEIIGNDYYSGGIFQTPAHLGQGASVQVLFGNSAIPQMIAPSGVTVAPDAIMLPLQGIGMITFGGGYYDWEIHTEEIDI